MQSRYQLSGNMHVIHSCDQTIHQHTWMVTSTITWLLLSNSYKITRMSQKLISHTIYKCLHDPMSISTVMNKWLYNTYYQVLLTFVSIMDIIHICLWKTKAAPSSHTVRQPVATMLLHQNGCHYHASMTYSSLCSHQHKMSCNVYIISY